MHGGLFTALLALLFFDGGDGSAGVQCLGRSRGLPTGQPSLELEEAGLGERLLGHRGSDSKKGEAMGT